MKRAKQPNGEHPRRRDHCQPPHPCRSAIRHLAFLWRFTSIIQCMLLFVGQGRSIDTTRPGSTLWSLTASMAPRMAPAVPAEAMSMQNDHPSNSRQEPDCSASGRSRHVGTCALTKVSAKETAEWQGLSELTPLVASDTVPVRIPGITMSTPCCRSWVVPCCSEDHWESPVSDGQEIGHTMRHRALNPHVPGARQT